MAQVSLLQDLPTDVLFHILSFLDIRDIVYVRNVREATLCPLQAIELTPRFPSLPDL